MGLTRTSSSSAVGLSVAVFLLYGCHLLGLNAQVAPYSSGDFISIDCGSDSKYEDSQGITWWPDDSYVSTGQKETVNATGAKLGYSLPSQIQKQLTTVRTFPGTRKKQCFAIPRVLSNTLYLVRLMFFAGNFTSEPVSFRITISNFDYTNVNITDSATPTVKELTFTSTTLPFSICLMRSVGTPFISSVELRPLYKSWYQSNDLKLAYVAFETLYRWNCGAAANSSTIRYPTDPFDRLWDPPPSTYPFESVHNFSAPIDNETSLEKRGAPTTVMQSAWAASANESISVSWPVTATSYVSFIAFAYLAEIFSTPEGSLREVNGTVSGVIENTKPIEYSSSIDGFFGLNFSSVSNVSVVPTARATLGPLLNALEVYNLYTFNNSYVTDTQDLQALDTIITKLNLTDWTGDPCLPYPWDWIRCSEPNDTTIASVTSINLSGYNLTGSIPSEISNLTQLGYLSLADNDLTGNITDLWLPLTLKELHLENNHFTGSVPSSLTTLASLSNVTLDNNNLSGTVPSEIENKMQAGSLIFSASGNPYLCLSSDDPSCNSSVGAPSPSESSGGSGSSSSSSVGAIVGGVVGCIAGLLVLAVFLFLCCRRRTATNTAGASSTKGKSSSASVMEASHHGRRFSLAEVKAATKGFQTEIGRGGFGLVYYGKLPDGQQVAVKVNKELADEGEATPEFLNEVLLLSRTHHRNLVSLVGYCDEEDQQILIYVFMSEGTLREHLDAETGRTRQSRLLDWKTRVDIAYNSARGLEYLHNSCSPPIIHRDVKSNNILLNRELMAKVADFGISKSTSDKDRTRGITTQIKGTRGYLDPEYFMAQRLTTKSDVYSFGVVLLEIVTGRKPGETVVPGGKPKYLQDWVSDSVRNGDIHSVIDPQMGSNYSVESIWKVVELAIMCVHREGSSRPDMQEVVATLLQAVQLQSRHTPTPITGHSPSQLDPSNFDSYQRVHKVSSSDSGGVVSWGSQVTAR